MKKTHGCAREIWVVLKMVINVLQKSLGLNCKLSLQVIIDQKKNLFDNNY